MSTPLFEEYENEDFSGPEEIEDPEKISKKVDKIFHNKYNSGEIDYEQFDLPQVDPIYADKNLQDCYNSQEYYRQKKLAEIIDKYFRETEFASSLIAKRKIPKMLLGKIFISIREKFTNSEYTGVEIFIGIGEYFNLNYELLYENIPAIYRAELVKELDNKYGILKRKGVKKLF
jgi:hypothetical protein